MTDPCSTYRESLNRLCLATAARVLRMKGTPPQDRDPKFFFIELVYPILVTGGPILSVFTEPGGIRLQQEDHIALHRGARVGGTVHEYQIDVVTEAALPTLLATIQRERLLLNEYGARHLKLLQHAPKTGGSESTKPRRRISGSLVTKIPKKSGTDGHAKRKREAS